YIEPYAPGNINKDSDEFYFKILDPLEKITKIQGKINKNQKGDAIKITSDDSNISKNLNIGDILEMGCSQNSLVEIFDFPSKGEVTPISGSSQKFYMDESGLEDYYSIYISSAIVIEGLTTGTIVFIKFNIKTKKLEAVLLNDREPHSATATAYEYVKIQLYHLTDNALAYPLSTAKLLSNKKPQEFLFTLNNTPFILDNIVEITCADTALNKVEITNFQTQGMSHRVINNKEYFKVTKSGLVPFTPTSVLQDNIITVRSNSNIYRNALTISFDTTSKTIKATAINEPIGSSGGWSGTSALIFTLKDKNGRTVKYDYVYGKDTKAIGRDGVAINLANNINNTPFDYGYSLELYAPARKYRFITKTRVFTSNLPFKSNAYCPFNDTETVTITELGLVLQSNSPLSNIKPLKDIIVLKNVDSQIMLQIYFNIQAKKLLVSSSSIKSAYNNSISNSEEYFVIKLTDKSGKETIGKITGDNNGDALADLLNNKVSFEYGDTITLACKDLRKISIENNPTYGEKYSLLKVNERFSITETGLVSLIRLLKNEITFLGFGNRLIAKIYFDIDDKKVLVSSSGTTAHSRFGDREYFKVVLKDSSDNLIKEASVKGNENGNNFAVLLNYLDFKDGYTITLIFAERNRVLISNYPKEGNTYKSPNNNSKTFTITGNGLILKA
ncbi:putative mucin/carbohydrate-binding domain-containing protein, partial [Clostridium tarantellae]